MSKRQIFGLMLGMFFIFLVVGTTLYYFAASSETKFTGVISVDLCNDGGTTNIPFSLIPNKERSEIRLSFNRWPTRKAQSSIINSAFPKNKGLCYTTKTPGTPDLNAPISVTIDKECIGLKENPASDMELAIYWLNRSVKNIDNVHRIVRVEEQISSSQKMIVGVLLADVKRDGELSNVNFSVSASGDGKFTLVLTRWPSVEFHEAFKVAFREYRSAGWKTGTDQVIDSTKSFNFTVPYEDLGLQPSENLQDNMETVHLKLQEALEKVVEEGKGKVKVAFSKLK